MSDQQFDVVVIGAGPGGEAAATRAVLRGASTCLIEAEAFGGTCLNVGCIPTKTLLAASQQFQAAKLAGATQKPDAEQILGRVGEVVQTLREAAERKMLTKKGLTVLRGRAHFLDPQTLSVVSAEGQQTIEAKSVIIATGAVPVRPGFLPWDSPRVLTSQEALGLDVLPESILILGGGVIGCEFATIYAELGIPVTLVEMLDTLLPGFEKEASDAVLQSLQQRDVKVLLGTKVEDATAADDAVEVQLSDGQTVTTSHLLSAIGRKPNTENLGLAEAGVELMEGRVAVDNQCRTNVPHIFAIGDVAHVRQFAHLAARMGVVAADNALGHELTEDAKVLPAGAYTHPEIATVGLTQAEAKEAATQAGEKIRVLRYAMRNSGIALCYGQTDGMLKISVGASSGKIFGALWIGPHATDLIQTIVLAIRHDLTVADLDATIHAHPTFVEALHTAVEPWVAQAIRKTF